MNRQKVQLQKLAQLAGAGKLARLLHNPIKYLYAMSMIHLQYPVTHKGSLKSADLFFGGSMQVLLPAATDIYLTGGKTHDSEIRLAKYLIANLEEGQSFLDIGAHFGYFTLLASALVGETGRVIGIEPAKNTFEVLNNNTAGKSNIQIRNNAVSNIEETVSFYEFPVLYSEYNALDVEKFRSQGWMSKNKPEQIQVEAVTIDALLRESGLEPAIIKIDVEGAEVQALTGGSNTWEKGRTTVIIEYLDEGDETSYTQAADVLYKNNYCSYLIDKNGGLVETKSILSDMRAKSLTSENVVFKKG